MTRALPAAVCLVALGVSSVSLTIWSTYYSNHPLWVEHAANGLATNLRFNEQLADEGYSATLRTTYNNSRFILQPSLLGFVPRLLASPDAHLLVTGPALLLFLALLARFVRQRTGDRFLAIAAVLVFCSLSGLFNERNGLGVPWPDFQSMFFLSAAVLSMGLYAVESKVGWLALAGACISLAALARDTGAAYSAVVCVPIFAVLLLIEIRRGRGWPAVAWLVAACGITALPAMVLLAGRFSWLQQYYMTANAAQLRQPLDATIESIWYLFSSFTGLLQLAGLALLFLGAQVIWPRRLWTKADIVVAYWPLSFVTFLVWNGYTSDVTKEVMYIAPGLVAAVATLGGGINTQSRQARTMVGVVLVICVIAGTRSATQAYDRASHPTEEARLLRQDQQALSKAVASIPQRVSWQSFSAYDWGTVVSSLSYYDFGHYQPSENRWFYNRKNYWDAQFPGLDLPQLQAHVLAQAEQHVDLAIVLAHPDQKPAGMEDYSFSIASYIAAHVQADPQWVRYGDVDSAVSGPLALYLNMRRVAATPRP